MIRIGSNELAEIEKKVIELRQNFIKFTLELALPKSLEKEIFPETFLSSGYYLAFPFLFKQAFKEKDNYFVNNLCICGYLYFKYLICIDSLHDKDLENHENSKNESILLLRSHVFHQQSLILLGKSFGSNNLFWVFWNNRNKEFFNSFVLDAKYNLDLSFEDYKKLSISKCSFLKTTIDAYYSKKIRGRKKLHESLCNSFDFLAIGRCIQDDVEDFKKDLLYKKNNLGHVLLKKWFTKQSRSMMEHSATTLEKYLYISKVAEEMLELSKKYFELAIDAVSEFKNDLNLYVKHIEALRNKSNLVKVNVEAYRITQYLSKVKSITLKRRKDLTESINAAEGYIAKLQNNDGSWYDISNKQGLSNVWSTGFIAFQLESEDVKFNRALNFLSKHRQKNLWGYNTDWIPDFDSSSWSILVMLKSGIKPYKDLDNWILGQQKNGGFSTYFKDDVELLERLGMRNQKQIKGWTSEHVCVSALAYYLLSDSNVNGKYKNYLDLLRKYLLKNMTTNYMWPSYWWTSKIYSTCYVIKGMLNENNLKLAPLIYKAVHSVMGNQNRDGSFSCDVLKQKSVFYTSMVLSTICYEKSLYLKYQKRADRMQEYILQNQYDDGGFQGSNFLVIPQPNSTSAKATEQVYKINSIGGSNVVTGEVSNLFSTSISLSALKSLRLMKNT